MSELNDDGTTLTVQFADMLIAIKENPDMNRKEYFQSYNEFYEMTTKLIENRSGIDKIYKMAYIFFQSYLREIKMVTIYCLLAHFFSQVTI